MSEQIIRRLATLQNAQGLHARPADLLARTAGQFDAQIWIEHSGEQVDAKSILSLLTLAAECGTQLLICAQGPDAEQAVHAVVDLIERGFQGQPAPDASDEATNET